MGSRERKLFNFQVLKVEEEIYIYTYFSLNICQYNIKEVNVWSFYGKIHSDTIHRYWLDNNPRIRVTCFQIK